MTQEYLEHYGKKGMKWGVRKKTTRTPTGKKARAEVKASVSKAGSKAKKAAQTKISALNTSANRKRVKRGAGFVSGILVTAGRKSLTNYAKAEFSGQLVEWRKPTGT